MLFVILVNFRMISSDNRYFSLLILYFISLTNVFFSLLLLDILFDLPGDNLHSEYDIPNLEPFLVFDPLFYLPLTRPD